MGRQKIPASLRQAVWLKHNGPHFYSKCNVSWCQTTITPFTYEVGHDTPFSKGGATNLANLQPICTSCNRSMGDRYTIEEYSKRFAPSSTPVHRSFLSRFFKCFKALV